MTIERVTDSKPMRLAALLCLVAGCGVAPVKSYYTLENTSTGKTARTAALCDMVLGVEPAHVYPPYDLTKIVFRPDDLEVRFYTNRYWVSAPEEMITKLITRRLKEAGLFSEVDASVQITGPHLTLLSKVHNLEETDKDDVWHGRIAMDFTLREEMEDVTLWQYSFDVTREVPAKEIKSVVEVLNGIYNEQMSAVVRSLEAFFRTNGGCGLKKPMKRDVDDDDDEDGQDAVDEQEEKGETPGE